LEPIDDRAVVAQGEALEAQRRSQEVSEHSFEGGAISRPNDDSGVHVHPLAQRARNLLRRRYQLSSGTGRFGYAEVHGALGVFDLKRSLKVACLT
jgi:hypothetical protein